MLSPFCYFVSDLFVSASISAPPFKPYLALTSLPLSFVSIISPLPFIMTPNATPLAHIPLPSPQYISHSLESIRPDMKDVSTASLRHSRNSLVYPKKRPSPHGVSKSHKSPLLPANGPARKSPRSAKTAIFLQRQREAQILALRREGVLLEEEYRDEIQYYMHDMEVCFSL